MAAAAPSSSSAYAGGGGGSGGGGPDAASNGPSKESERNILPLFHLPLTSQKNGNAELKTVRRHSGLYQHLVFSIVKKGMGNSPVNLAQLRLESNRLVLAMLATLSEGVFREHKKDRDEYEKAIKKVSARSERAEAKEAENLKQQLDEADAQKKAGASAFGRASLVESDELQDAIDAASRAYDEENDNIQANECASVAGGKSGGGGGVENDQNERELMRRLPPVYWVVEVCMKETRTGAPSPEDLIGPRVSRQLLAHETDADADGDGDVKMEAGALDVSQDGLDPLPRLPNWKNIEIYRIHMYVLSKFADGGSEDYLARAVRRHVAVCTKEDLAHAEKENKIHSNKPRKVSLPANLFFARARTLESIKRICMEYDPITASTMRQDHAPAVDGETPFSVYDYFSLARAMQLGNGMIRSRQSQIANYACGAFPYRELSFSLSAAFHAFNVNKLMAFYFPWAPGLREVDDQERKSAIEATLDMSGADSILTLLPNIDKKDHGLVKRFIAAHLAQSQPLLHSKMIEARMKEICQEQRLMFPAPNTVEHTTLKALALFETDKMAQKGKEYVRDAASAYCLSIPSMVRKGVLDESPLLYFDDFKARLDPKVLAIEEELAREETKCKEVRDRKLVSDLANLDRGASLMDIPTELLEAKRSEAKAKHAKKKDEEDAMFIRKRNRLVEEQQEALFGDFEDMLINTGEHHKAMLSNEQVAILNYFKSFLEENKGSMNLVRNPRLEDASSFVEFMQTILDIEEHAMLTVGKHSLQQFVFFAAWTVYLPPETAVTHVVATGPPGTGKSSLFKKLIEFSIKGSVRSLQYMSDKSLMTDKKKNNGVMAHFDEPPLRSLVADKKGGEENEAMQFMKSLLSNHVTSGQTLDQIERKVDGPDGPMMVKQRSTRVTHTQNRWSVNICQNQNARATYVPAICDRLAIFEVTQKHTLGPVNGKSASLLDKNAPSSKGRGHPAFVKRAVGKFNHMHLGVFLIGAMYSSGLMRNRRMDTGDMEMVARKILATGRNSLHDWDNYRTFDKFKSVLDVTVAVDGWDRAFCITPLFPNDHKFRLSDIRAVEPFLIGRLPHLVHAFGLCEFFWVQEELEQVRCGIRDVLFPLERVVCPYCMRGKNEPQSTEGKCTKHGELWTNPFVLCPNRSDSSLPEVVNKHGQPYQSEKGGRGGGGRERKSNGQRQIRFATAYTPNLIQIGDAIHMPSGYVPQNDLEVHKDYVQRAIVIPAVEPSNPNKRGFVNSLLREGPLETIAVMLHEHFKIKCPRRSFGLEKIRGALETLQARTLKEESYRVLTGQVDADSRQAADSIGGGGGGGQQRKGRVSPSLDPAAVQEFIRHERELGCNVEDLAPMRMNDDDEGPSAVLSIGPDSVRVSLPWLQEDISADKFAETMRKVLEFKYADPSEKCTTGALRERGIPVWDFVVFAVVACELNFENPHAPHQDSLAMIESLSGDDLNYRANTLFLEEAVRTLTEGITKGAIRKGLRALGLSDEELARYKERCPIWPEDEQAWRTARVAFIRSQNPSYRTIKYETFAGVHSRYQQLRNKERKAQGGNEGKELASSSVARPLPLVRDQSGVGSDDSISPNASLSAYSVRVAKRARMSPPATNTPVSAVEAGGRSAAAPRDGRGGGDYDEDEFKAAMEADQENVSPDDGDVEMGDASRLSPASRLLEHVSRTGFGNRPITSSSSARPDDFGPTSFAAFLPGGSETARGSVEHKSKIAPSQSAPLPPAQQQQQRSAPAPWRPDADSVVDAVLASDKIVHVGGSGSSSGMNGRKRMREPLGVIGSDDVRMGNVGSAK